jgi:hypothetical protein
MPWSAQKPMDGTDVYKFQREIHTRLKFGSFTWNPPNVPAASTVDTVLTTSDSGDFVGLRVGMSVSVSPPSAIDAGLGWGAFVATDDTLTVRLVNATALGINAASGTWSFHGMVI